MASSSYLVALTTTDIKAMKILIFFNLLKLILTI